MPNMPLNLTPGIVKDVSSYSVAQAGAYWVDGENIRWIDGDLAKRGGHIDANINCSGEGVPRKILLWLDNAGEQFMAVATHQKLLLIYNEQCFDITPTGLSLGASPSYASGRGWGAGSWNQGTWGTPRAVANLDFEPTAWSLANFGEDLIACARGGGIYYWQRNGGISGNTANRAVNISTLPGATMAPVGARIIATSMPDRHVVAAGTDPLGSATELDPLLIRWSAMNSVTDWSPDRRDTGGDQILEHGTEVVAMVAARNQMLISTDYAIYVLQFIGPPRTFAIELLATGCPAISIESMVEVNGVVYWMSNNEFYRYRGGLPEILPCPVKYFVFDDMNPGSSKLVFAALNTEFNEVAWHYTDRRGRGKYVVWNYLEDWWSLGTSEATAWADVNGLYDRPISFTASGQMRFEETGENLGTSALPCFGETASFEIGEGDHLMYLKELIPDFQTLNGEMDITITGKKYPNAEDLPAKSATVSNSSRRVNMKYKARQFRLKFAQNTPNSHFQIGSWRADVKAISRR